MIGAGPDLKVGQAGPGLVPGRDREGLMQVAADRGVRHPVQVAVHQQKRHVTALGLVCRQIGRCRAARRQINPDHDEARRTVRAPIIHDVSLHRALPVRAGSPRPGWWDLRPWLSETSLGSLWGWTCLTAAGERYGGRYGRE